MNERIKELAEQAGGKLKLVCYGHGDYRNDFQLTGNEIKRFAELIRADEREACAKLCESMGVHPALNVYNGGPEWYKRQKECAEAIRQRGDSK